MKDLHRYLKDFKVLKRFKSLKGINVDWQSNVVRGALVVAGVAVLGVFFLIQSHAATPSVSLEAEQGNLSGAATKVTDGKASGGSAVQFGSATPPCTDCSCSGTCPGGGGGGGGPYIAYPLTSFFRAPLGQNWPVDSTSATGIAFLKNKDPWNFPKLNGVGGNQWGIGFALGTCNDPVWKFQSGAKVPAGQSFLMTQGFHAPLGWEKNLPNNNDAPIEVIDTCGVPARPHGFTVWGANVTYNGNSQHILTTNPNSNSGSIIGGSFSHDTNGLDHRTQHSNDTQGLNETSRGNIPDSFGIRDDLLRYGMSGGNNGTLGHVLQIYFVETDSAMGNVPPMAGHENGQSGYGAEGERIAVKPSWTPPAGCTGAARVVARTLQDYGAYIGNNSGSGSGIKVQQNSTLLQPQSLGACISWDDMAFVQRGWSSSW